MGQNLADNFLAAQDKNHEAPEEHEDKPGHEFHSFSFLSFLIFMVTFPLFRELPVPN